MSEKHKKMCQNLNYFENFLVFISAVTGCVSISTFSSLVGVPAEVVSSAVRLKICRITVRIKKYNSIINNINHIPNKFILLTFFFLSDQKSVEKNHLSQCVQVQYLLNITSLGQALF